MKHFLNPPIRLWEHSLLTADTFVFSALYKYLFYKCVWQSDSIFFLTLLDGLFLSLTFFLQGFIHVNMQLTLTVFTCRYETFLLLGNLLKCYQNPSSTSNYEVRNGVCFCHTLKKQIFFKSQSCLLVWLTIFAPRFSAFNCLSSAVYKILWDTVSIPQQSAKIFFFSAIIKVDAMETELIDFISCVYKQAFDWILWKHWFMSV